MSVLYIYCIYFQFGFKETVHITLIQKCIQIRTNLIQQKKHLNFQHYDHAVKMFHDCQISLL